MATLAGGHRSLVSAVSPVATDGGQSFSAAASALVAGRASSPALCCCVHLLVSVFPSRRSSECG